MSKVLDFLWYKVLSTQISYSYMKNLIFVFHGPSGERKIWVPALNIPNIFYWPFSNILNIFLLRVHQLPNHLSEYMVVSYQWMQNAERVL